MGYIKTIIDEFNKSKETYYNMIFKRKSFHNFDKILKISNEELELIEEKYKKLVRLKADIKTEIKIVPASETTSNVGAEYCILFFSEKKDNYLQNIGYLGQQLDLFLPSLNIGTLWCGRGQPNITEHNGLDYVIMLCIAKVEEEQFRKDMYSIPRKPLNDIWIGENLKEFGNIARFAPSARNSQPWKVIEKNNKLLVYRDRRENDVSKEKRDYFNNIDIGIFMCVLDVILRYNNFKYCKGIYLDSFQDQNEKFILNADYIFK